MLRCFGGHGGRRMVLSCLPLTIPPFIPGDFSLLGQATPFLTQSTTQSTFPCHHPVTIFRVTHAHLGLSSFIGGNHSFPNTCLVTLPALLQARVKFLDELLAAYGPETSVPLAGHSIGAWFTQEIQRVRTAVLTPAYALVRSR
ncbi:hypothetical protein BJY52DRAFT_444231 [Lactarius psammicola]|nr:hypothetical protein BJY52DRAFT_444231 [Lactarius psammicola]